MKRWYTSKTLWINLIAVIALLVQSYTSFVISPEIQTAALALINFVLRLVTKQPLDWGADVASSDTPSGPPAQAGFIRLPLLLAMAAVGLWLLAGCATTNPAAPTPQDSPQVLAGKSLLAVKSTIVTAATATAALCRAGTLPADTCAQANTAYEQAKPAYDAAVDAYLLMTSQGGDTADFGAALTRVQSIAANLLKLSGGAK